MGDEATREGQLGQQMPAKDAAEAAKPTPSKWDNILVVGLVVYALVLAVLAADQLFNLGLFPPELDKMLRRDIRTLAAIVSDPNLTDEEKKAKAQPIAEEIVNYHEFSVPHLIKALESKDTRLHDPAAQCLVQIGARFFKLPEAQGKSFGTDPAKWKEWWKQTQAELDRRAT